MKGVIFTEQYAFVESRQSSKFLQQVLNDAPPPVKGACAATAAGSACAAKALAAFEKFSQTAPPAALNSR